MKYYIAYGSNLSLAQMAERCPDAVPVGRTVIQNYRLLFKGSMTGAYLTVEKAKGYAVEGVIWQISEEDEKRLDHYEGCPDFYYKKTMEVPLIAFAPEFMQPARVESLIYIMHEERRLGIPSDWYVETCYEGFKRFGLNVKRLKTALKESLEMHDDRSYS